MPKYERKEITSRDRRYSRDRSLSEERSSKKSRERSKTRSRKSDHKSKKKSKSRDRSKSRSRKKKHRQGRFLFSIFYNYFHKTFLINGFYRSSSSSSSVSSDGSLKLLQRLQNERIQQALEKKREKEAMKANETPEEKRARRLREKLEKERKRKERMGWDNEYQHYTNTDNPFGDGNLTSTFVWSKKLDKEGLKNISHEEIEVRNRHKQLENKMELEKVKKRRLERELEKQQREEEQSMMQRSKEAAQFEEWERQEDRFHLEQARLRSCIRIQDGRAKPIDLLAKYINSQDEVDAVEMHEPYTYLNGLDATDLEDLIEDIKVYKELEKGNNIDYWNDLTVIVEDELHKLRKIAGQAESAAVVRREGIHQAVVKDVTEVFKGKTTNQLDQLQKQIENKISGTTTDGIDIGYWESLLSQLKAHMARARLRDKHQEILKRKLQLLQAEQQVSTNSESVEHVAESRVPVESNTGQAANKPKDNDRKENTENSEEEVDYDSDESQSPARDLLTASFALYEQGCYSPVYLTPAQLEPGTVIVEEEVDTKRLEFKRDTILNGSSNKEQSLSKLELSLRTEARRGMGGDEAEFSVEAGIGEFDIPVYLWSDKYRPRKPRYFNRVHTGFEWNKYNQTHYDMDNPPPKIVQGYKFNIFYPDLINKSDTPEYFLTPCPDNKDFAILRFKAGPPYEDIAFKIVAREWEYSYKRGFRCQFHNNVFQLWFHFKRYRYRR
ncbi:LOW QUALITY PROTEIN: cactin-like [Ctenocephalides felis]|uniref:LOW QUALITY PROTEIN: cactin-like n=1 Tax=Ctenocephalides felis TaxID=7515 RepID=UPI000E6E2BDD|nr:LOW QUALITY PROTEIN: cactin-like [Ctenocephalides felis]